MDSATGNMESAPTLGQIEDLRRLAAGIIRAQGNRFIKELLRSKGIRIGANKTDFERNLFAAINSGELKLGDIDDWLKLVEGWGNQHVYLYNISRELRSDLTRAKIRQRVKTAGLDNIWDGATVLAFPDKPELTSISFSNSVLSLVWQEASPGWTPIPDKNFIKQENLDTFEYRAWRMVERRAITRFEAHLEKGLAGLFVSDPIQGDAHQAAIDEAKRVISSLMNLSELEDHQVDISDISKNLDQQNVPTNVTPNPEVKVHKSRLASGGAYVEFAANSRDKAYWEAPAIQNVRSSVRKNQLSVFEGIGGVFIFQEISNPNVPARPLRVQLIGKNNRIRMWAQMEVGEVWAILTKLSTYQ